MSVGELLTSLSFGTFHVQLVEQPTTVISLVADGATEAEIELLARQVMALPAVIVATGADASALASAADVVLARDEDRGSNRGWLQAIVDGVHRAPLAAAALVMLMRAHPGRHDIQAGLIAESATYSMLQAGPEFRSWRSTNSPRRPRETTPAVHLERIGATLLVTLDRPHVRNALNAAMQAELVEAFGIALADPSLTTVALRGNGPGFCSGGDLDEFGAFRDPSSAHVVRVSRSPARLAAAITDRLEVHLHGACAGSGIEIPAFARRVVAAPDTVISLPELRLGLIPGAGGTVSVAGRIGRQRTVQLVLSGAEIDARTALHWGLVDEISAAD
ncbi:MAG TPA: enoyl-CoA hydratase/isomerase family protein [Ilumatobacteraceae bacterium]